MNSRERLLATLEHRLPDKVPYDLAGSHVSGIHVVAYKNLCNYLGVDYEPVVFADVIQQAVIPSQQILDRFDVDTRGLFPLCSHNWNVEGKDMGEYYEYVGEWRFTYHFPKNGGHYWSLVKSPIDGMMAERDVLDAYQWPWPDNPERIKGLRDLAVQYRNNGKIVMIKSLCAGLFEMGQRIRGMENFLCDLIADKDTASLIMDNVLRLKKKFWKMVIDELGDVVDILVEMDDYGTQQSQLISKATYEEIMEPRLRELISFMKSTLNAKKSGDEKGYIFFHSCGNIRSLLPGFVDMGIDIINPVQITAEGMEPESLKADFGGKVTFWGGGVDTQGVLPEGTPQQVREDVKKNVEILKQGGGYVFNTVHNIQAEVPPENIIAMWEALQEYGKY